MEATVVNFTIALWGRWPQNLHGKEV